MMECRVIFVKEGVEYEFDSVLDVIKNIEERYGK
jgi:hypothetical protein